METERNKIFTKDKRETIRDSLARVLASPGFVNSAQLSNFLSFIVERTLQGRGEEIKGYTIGVEALGRPDDFDPATDPSVRVMAGRLRTALATYNNETKPYEKVTIHLPKGAYVPHFEFNEKRSTSEEIKAHEANSQKAGPTTLAKSKRSPLRIAALAGIFLAVAGSATWFAVDYASGIQLPEPQILTLEQSELPLLSLSVSHERDTLPQWLSPGRVQSSTIIAFSRFNEFRVIDLAERHDTGEDGKQRPDYHLWLLITGSEDEGAADAFATLYKPPTAEVIWSEKVTFDRPPGGVNTRYPTGMAAVVSELMSPYGVIHGDIINRKNPPPRLDCIRAIYDYFARENLQSYSNGLECAKRVEAAGNASSSMYALLSFLHVEAYRKNINGVAFNPLSEARKMADLAVTLDSRNARAFQAVFAVEKVTRNVAAAELAAQRAMALNPFDRDIIGDYAAWLISNERFVEATPFLEQALSLTPALPAWLRFYAYLHARELGKLDKSRTIASTIDINASPLSALAVLLDAHNQNDMKRRQNAIEALASQDNTVMRDPAAALIRHGFSDTLANRLAGDLKAAGLYADNLLPVSLN